MAADSTLSEFNKIVPNLVLASKCTAAQTNQERHSRNQILKNPVEICTIFHFVFESFLSNHLEIIFLAAAAEGIFIEGVNFQRITNSKRILDSWFRFEIFWMNFPWKNAIGIGKMSLRRRFYKVQAGSKWKRRGLLGSETFYMWSCSLAGLDCVRLHVYLSLAWALLFQ